MDFLSFAFLNLTVLYVVTWASRESLRREVEALREELGK